MYYNYHAKVRRLISEGHLTGWEIADRYKNIRPAIVLHFDNHPPLPIRQHRWAEYLLLLDPDKIIDADHVFPKDY